jgi:hypothetical protein
LVNYQLYLYLILFLQISDNELNNIADVVEAPKFITVKHVAAVLDKLEYSTEDVSTLFDSLCELATVERKKHKIGSIPEESESGKSGSFSTSKVTADDSIQNTSSIGRLPSSDEGSLEIPDASQHSNSMSSDAMSPSSSRSRARTQSNQEYDSDNDPSVDKKFEALQVGQKILDVDDFIRYVIFQFIYFACDNII